MANSQSLRAAGAGVLLALFAGATPSYADAARPVVGGERLAGRGTIVATLGRPLPPGGRLPRLPRTTASGWLVADLGTGDVLAARDPHGRYAPASTLKILTALTLLPRLPALRRVVPTFADVSVDGTRVGLVEHDAYPVGQLLAAMLIASGNDAAHALATANGGVRVTLEQMNAQAQHLQAYDTYAATPDGLDAAGQRSSAYDLALLARAAMSLPSFRQLVATKRSVVRSAHTRIEIDSHDKLLYNYPGAIGIKNGFTVKARATFVGAATRGGRTLVVTMLHTDPRYWPEAAGLLDWGFAAERAGLLPIGHLVGPAAPRAAVTADLRVPVLRPAATALISRHRTSGGLPLLPLSGLGAALALVALVVRRRFT